MNLLWLTDIHINFLDEEKTNAFISKIHAKAPTHILISGDIGDAYTLIKFLDALEKALSIPIYFVLGNHDFYHSSISNVREQIATLCKNSKCLFWLNNECFVSLSDNIALIGHDSWGDARYGDIHRSSLWLNDFELIEELVALDPFTREKKLNALGDEAAAHFQITLPEALAHHDKVILLTHVPPFRQACLYMGKVSVDGLPFFACKSVGDVLVNIMKDNPKKNLSVYCGHTHNKAYFKALPNLEVHTGAAKYGAPVAREINISS